MSRDTLRHVSEDRERSQRPHFAHRLDARHEKHGSAHLRGSSHGVVDGFQSRDLPDEELGPAPGSLDEEEHCNAEEQRDDEHGEAPPGEPLRTCHRRAAWLGVGETGR